MPSPLVAPRRAGLAFALALWSLTAPGCGDAGVPTDGGAQDQGASPDVGTGGDQGTGPDGSATLDGSAGPDAGGALDGGPGPDGSPGPDAGGGVDGGAAPDGGGALPDLGIPTGSGDLPPECFDGNGDLALCQCIRTPDCSVDACPADTVCVSDGCGGQRCVGAGHPCVDASDCAQGGSCVTTPVGRVCRPPGMACRDTVECPLGFTCENANCEDRRVFCGNELETCPVGYTCDLSLRESQPFCRRWDEPCAHAETCPQPGGCIDLDGDGQRECVPPELECVAATCTRPEQICGNQPFEKAYQCGSLGNCAVQECSAPYACRDLADDGRPSCVPEGGCSSHADCGSNEVCGLPHGETAPRCFGSVIGDLP